MKTPNLKIISCAAILLICFSIVYYFILFLHATSSSNKEHSFEVTRQCSEDGKQVYDQIISKIEAEPGDPLYGKNYDVVFNEDLNKCLLEYEYSYGSVTAKYIIDVYSSEELVSYFKNGDAEGEVTLQQYKNEYKQLFVK